MTAAVWLRATGSLQSSRAWAAVPTKESTTLPPTAAAVPIFACTPSEPDNSTNIGTNSVTYGDDPTMMPAALAFAALIVASGFQQVPSDSEAIHFGPAPAWTLPLPAPIQSTAPDGPAVRVIYFDTETRSGSNGIENYFAYR